MRSSSSICLLGMCAMSEVLTLQAAVKEEANARNGEVIGRAFGFADIFCVDCRYPQNASDFGFWLRTHTSEKIDLHRAKRRRSYHERGDWCNSYREAWYQYSPCAICNEHGNEVLKLEREASLSRSFLRRAWPCVECIKRYNPTARIRHMARNFPELKGFLDVRFE